MFGGRERRIRIAASDCPRHAEKAASGSGGFDGKNRLKRLDLHSNALLCGVEGFAGLARQKHDRLADIANGFFGQDAVVVNDRPIIVLTRHIPICISADNAGYAMRCGDIDHFHSAVSHGAADEIDEQLAERGRRVVNVRGLARHMSDGRFMRNIFANDAHHARGIRGFLRLGQWDRVPDRQILSVLMGPIQPRYSPSVDFFLSR